MESISESTIEEILDAIDQACDIELMKVGSYPKIQNEAVFKIYQMGLIKAKSIILEKLKEKKDA